MNFKNNPPFWIMTGIALVFACMWWLHKCEVCPPLKTVHTVTSDSAMFHDELDSSTIKATSITPRPKSNSSKNSSSSIVSKDSSILDMKKSFVEMVDMCDSLKTEHESEHVFDIDISDSVMTGHIKQTISEDQVVKFSFRRTYKFPVTTDSTIQMVPSIKEKSCMTGGLFSGGNKDHAVLGLLLGYRWKKNDLFIGHDFINKTTTANYKIDFW